MNPDPKARKYFRYSRCQLVLMIISPPKRLARAARTPKSKLVVRGDMEEIVDSKISDLGFVICYETSRALAPIRSADSEVVVAQEYLQIQNPFIRCGGS
jgi:hypothetical protein